MEAGILKRKAMEGRCGGLRCVLLLASREGLKEGNAVPAYVLHEQAQPLPRRASGLHALGSGQLLGRG